MKRKSMAAIIISFALAVSMMAGCGNKQADMEAVTFEKTKIGNVIAKDPVRLSDLLYKVTLKKGQTVKEVSLAYGGETVKIEAGKEPGAGKVFTVAKDKAIKELVDKNNVPNAILTFATPTKTASDLKVSLTLMEKDKKTSTEMTNIEVRVLPEAIKPVKAITQNLKLSEDLKDYDFDVRAKNIAEKAKEITSITVKKSNVKFGKAGHYEVTYEVKLAPESVDVTTDAQVVDKETEKSLPKDEVTKENVKPGETIEVTTDEKDATAKTDNNAPSGNNAASGNSSNSGTSSGNDSSSSANNSSSSGSNNSANNNTGNGSSSSSPQPAPHTHNWKAHTATKNEWVPNVVTVDDYADQPQHRCDFRCSACGSVFTSGEACDDHQMAGCFGGSQTIACTHTTRVKVGSHTEDHGHYEARTYTDYEYCDCGATR